MLAMSEMGKGVWLKQRLRKLRPKKLIIWDINDEYDGLADKVTTFSQMLAFMYRGQAYAVRFVSEAKTDKKLRQDFDTFCTLVYAAQGATIVVEELADVTSASYAPPAWRRLNTRGRHHQGLTLYWCSQSPAWVDKAALGNATHLHVGYLGEPAHREAAGRHMACRPEEIDALVQFEFIEYVKATKARTHGRVSLDASSPPAKKRRAR